MTFASQMNGFANEYKRRERAIFHRVVELVFEAIVLGLILVGSPGQPVDTGALRASWSVTWISPSHAQISSDSGYAVHVEENVRGVTFRVGGPHNVKLVRAGFQRIYEQARNDVFAAAA